MLAERRQIVELWKRGGAAVLATLVRVEGSSYRRPGARLLIAGDGLYAGAISGGCLEAEVLRKAQWLVREGATLQRYSTLFDDTADIPYGLGCGGTVDVLLEPAATPACEALLQAMDVSLTGTPRHVRTQLPDSDRSLVRCVADEHGALLYRSSERLFAAAAPAFEEILEPPQRLFIFGAGNDAQPLARIAALLGWTVIIADGRAQWARAERFPEAAQVLLVRDFSDVRLGENDAAVVMTHSYEQDRSALLAMLPQAPRYLGLLGARHRSALLLTEAATVLQWGIDHTSERVFAPVGLDLGGDGAEAIALAVVAEIQACMEGRLPAARHMSAALIAEQLAQGGASRYVQTQCAL